MQGVFNPDCFDPFYERHVTIRLANEPNPLSLGTLSSSEAGGNPDWPVSSTFDAHLMVEIVGDQPPDSILQLVSVHGLNSTLQNDNLWALPTCSDASEAFTAPGDDHFFIPCDPVTAGGDSLVCCSRIPAVLFVAPSTSCSLLHGAWQRASDNCDGCMTESIMESPESGAFLIGKIGPNPSPGSVRIQYTMRNTTAPRIEIFDAAGRSVRRFALGEQAAGAYELVWDGRNDSGREVAAGVYFLRMRAGDARAMKGIVLMR